ncbi:2-dehydro-3-deoxygalactonokinase [Inquilinus sp. CAU 1745]|uniref:2-dehydro-3-deoxygalactonokinase n=1 Tax=Inquilinus sp. CAU 1745 TaxID=3140369 RepID=UPI00325A5616
MTASGKAAPGHRVVLDWGTSSFRAILVGEDGEVLARQENGNGIASVSEGGFAGVLEEALASWRASHGVLPIVAAGMIGSRNGWVETPYVPTPATADDIAAGCRRIDLGSGEAVTFIPGLTDPTAIPFPDVMRGEETQLVGFGLEADATIILPGTHSKWSRVGGGRIQRFQTFVTGEMFGLLSRHSFIAGTAAEREPGGGNDRPSFDPASFDRGLAAARDEEARAGGLLARLFGLRTGWLSGALAPAAMSGYLSGLVVGWEFAEARQAGWFTQGDAVAIVGDEDMVEIYRRAGEAFGLTVRSGPADAALAGALALMALSAGD